MFFSCSCWMRSALALLSFSKQRTLCTYWLFKNFKSDDSWSSFLTWVLSSETRQDYEVSKHHVGWRRVRATRFLFFLPLVTRSFSSFSLRSSWCSSLFSRIARAFSALYGSRRASKFRLSFSVFPADSLALRRLSVVWTRSLWQRRRCAWSHYITSTVGELWRTAGAGGLKASPEQFLH